MKTKKIQILGCSFAIIISIVGCSTPNAVKELSNQLLVVQEEQLQALKQYFKLVETFVESQIEVSKIMINSISTEINSKQKEKTIRALNDSDNSDTRKILTEFEDSVLSQAQFDHKAILQIEEHLNDLKATHREILLAYENILKAHEKLNEYIQFKRADEVLVSELLATVGIQKERVEDGIKTSTSIYNTLKNDIIGLTGQ